MTEVILFLTLKYIVRMESRQLQPAFITQLDEQIVAHQKPVPVGIEIAEQAGSDKQSCRKLVRIGLRDLLQKVHEG